MNDSLISTRYAKAMLEYASSRSEDKVLYERMKLLAKNLGSMPRLRETLLSAMVGYDDKMALIINAGGNSVEESYRNMARVVLSNQRERLLHNIALSYMTLYRRVHRISVVTLISVEPLSEAIIDRIRYDVSKRTSGEVEFETHIDPKIEGGFIFQVDDLRLDASIRGQLEAIRREFIRKNRIIV